jgi:type I restriction enzyme S subunit
MIAMGPAPGDLRPNPDWARLPLFDREGWRRVRFGDVVTFVKETVDPNSGELERYIAGEHMDSENIHLRRWGTVGDGYLGPAFIRRFRKGQVLYGSRRTYLKKVAYAEFDGITANTTFVLESVEGKLYQPLLPWIMLSERFTEHSIKESKGSTNPYINWPDIAKFEFALPPLEQQRRIAEVLWAVDEVYCEIAGMIEKSASFRRSYLGSVFANPNGNNSLPIRETGLVQLGRQRAPKYQTGTMAKPYLRVANVYDGYFNYDDVLEMDFDEKDFETYRLQKGDILLNEGQSRELVGRCAIYDGAIEDCCFQNTLIRYRPGEKVLTEFAYAFFQYCFHFGVFAAIASQTTSVAHLGAERFGNLPMPVPPKEEQSKIAHEYRQLCQTEFRLIQHLRKTQGLQKNIIENLM